MNTFIIDYIIAVQTNSHQAFNHMQFWQVQKNYMLHAFMQHKLIKCIK